VDIQRRDFNKMLLAVVGGVITGATVGCGTPKKKATSTPTSTAAHACAKQNACKGKGVCATGDKGCAGKNTCKGAGGCASKEYRHECKGKNDCKGQGGCGVEGKHKCRGQNECKTLGACAVPKKS
jgi:hypothetical protein